jgi:hypothetical protein
MVLILMFCTKQLFEVIANLNYDVKRKKTEPKNLIQNSLGPIQICCLKKLLGFVM